MILRMFDTAVDPEDVEAALRLFRDDVRPVFESFEGCRGIEMAVGLDDHSGGLIDIVALSRWDSKDAIEKARASGRWAEALEELKKLFQQSPIVRHFELPDSEH